MEDLPRTDVPVPDNALVASRCERIAWLLEAQDANPYRLRAWREAAAQIRDLPTSVVETCRRGGKASLISIPHIGRGIAGVIEEYARTGRFHLLDSLEGGRDTEALLCCVPGIGPALAKRIQEELLIDSLEELELAAHDGRLDALPGFGPRRLQAIRAELDSMLRRATPRRNPATGEVPTVDLLLEIDREYLQAAKAGKLRTILPRRFNPKGSIRIPIWHVDRDGWHFTVLFSNSARAHQAGKTRDWVLIFFEGPQGHGQITAISLRGRRVLRGLPKPPTGVTPEAAKTQPADPEPVVSRS